MTPEGDYCIIGRQFVELWEDISLTTGEITSKTSFLEVGYPRNRGLWSTDALSF